MHRKMLAICAALMGFAIVPAMATAAVSPTLTENGASVAVGQKITATGEETSNFSSGFINVECNDFWLTGTVVKNANNTIEGTIENASYNSKNAEGVTEDCHSNIGATKVTIPGLTNEGGTQHWCVIATAANPDVAEVFPHSCGGAGGEFTFVLNNTPTGTICRYRRTAKIEATFKTNETPATLKLKGEPAFELEQPSSGFCSATGKLTKMNFTLETDASPFTPLSIS